MPWIPTGTTSAASTGVTTDEFVDDAATKTVSVNNYNAVYDPASHRTYFAYTGLDRDLYVTYWDHVDGTVATPVLADDRTISVSDAHSPPSVCLDLDGHIHIAWASHNDEPRHVKSDNPWDISAWTGQSFAEAGTYEFIQCDPATGDLYVIDRAGSGGHGSGFPSHAYGQIRKSTDGGSTWAAAVSIVDTSGSPESASDFYPLIGVAFGADGLLHFSWTVARGSGHDDNRTNIYHAKYDPTDGTLYAADDTDLGSEINWSEHADCLAATRSNLVAGNMVLDGDRIVIFYGGPESGNRVHYVTVWDGSSWTDTATGIDAWDVVGHQMPYLANGHIRALLVNDNGNGFGDVDLYGGLEDGTDWHKISNVLLGDSGEGYTRVAPVGGGGPMVAIAMQAQSGNPNTNATGSDLLSVQAIFDPDAVQHDHSGDHNHDSDYAASGHDHDDSYYTEAEVDSLIAGVEAGGEILISDSPSTPLVFADLLQNEDQDDLVYSD